MIIPIAEGLDSPSPGRAWTRSEGGEEVPQMVIWGPVNEKYGWMLAFETSAFCYVSLSFFPSVRSSNKPAGARCKGYGGEQEGPGPAIGEQVLCVLVSLSCHNNIP